MDIDHKQIKRIQPKREASSGNDFDVHMNIWVYLDIAQSASNRTSFTCTNNSTESELR